MNYFELVICVCRQIKTLSQRDRNVINEVICIGVEAFYNET